MILQKTTPLCRGKCCCPEIKQLDKDTIQITDDFGGLVKMKVNEFEKALSVFNQIMKDKRMAE